MAKISIRRKIIATYAKNRSINIFSILSLKSLIILIILSENILDGFVKTLNDKSLKVVSSPYKCESK